MKRKEEHHRFLHEVVIPYTGDDCLVWPFVRDGRHGYAKIGRRGRVCRIVCEAVHGSPPDIKYEARHICSNGHLGCVNPRHLIWGTHAENMADIVAHGHAVIGERNGNAKLTAQQVHEIRALAGTMQQKEIAKRYGVGPMQISRIIRRKRWRMENASS